MKHVRIREWGVLLIVLVYSFIPTFGGLLRVVELGGGPAIIPENPRALADPLPVIGHIVSSFLFCVLGALQFLPSIRRHSPGLHRALGRVVAAAGCVSALTGLWMTLFFVFPDDLQGGLLYGARVVLSLCMVGLILQAVSAIKAKNVLRHGAAMLRAYAIGQGASTQAFLGLCWVVAFGTEPAGPLRDGVMVFAWGLNLLIAEGIIRTLIPRRTPSRVGAGR